MSYPSWYVMQLPVTNDSDGGSAGNGHVFWSNAKDFACAT